MSNWITAYFLLGTIVILDCLWAVKCVKRKTKSKKKSKSAKKKPWIIAEDNIGNAVGNLIFGNFFGLFSLLIWLCVRSTVKVLIVLLLWVIAINLMLLAVYYLCRFVKIGNDGITARSLMNKDKFYSYSEIKKIRLRFGGAILFVPWNVIYLDEECNWNVLRKYLIADWEKLTYKHKLINLLPDGRIKNSLVYVNTQINNSNGAWLLVSLSMFVYALIFVCIGRNVTVPFSDLVFEQITVTHAETVESYGSTKIWFDYYIYAKDDRIFIIDDYYAAHGLTGFFSAFKKEEFQESLTGNDIIDVAFIEENGKLKVYEVYKNGIAYMTYQDCVRVNNRQNGSRIITIMALLFISIIILVKKVLWPKKRE